MKTTKRILSLLLCMALVLGIIPIFASAEGETYTKVTSADEITSGQYVMINAAGYAPTTLSGSWVLNAKPTVDGETVTDAAGAVFTLTVDGSSVKLQDANGTFISPGTGNTNTIKSGEYAWNMVVAADGTVQFKGTGSDTTTLASNKNSSYKFRAYKNTTCTNETNYPTYFTLYKLDEAVDPDAPVCAHANLNAAIHVEGKHVVTCADCGETMDTEEVITTTYTDDNHTTTCSCGEYTVTEAHTLSDWTVKTPATAAAPGEEIKTCSGCDYTMSQEIPQLESTGKHYIKYTNANLLSGTYIMIAGAHTLGAFEDGWILPTQAPVIDENTVSDDMGGVWTLTVTDTGVILTDANGVTVAPKAGNNNGIISGDYVWAWAYDEATGTYSFSGVGSDTTKLACNTDTQNGLNRFRAYKTSTISGNTTGTYITAFTLYKLEGEQSCAHETVYTTTETTHISACGICGEVFIEESLHDIKGENGTCSVCSYEVDKDVLAAAIIEAAYALESGASMPGVHTLTGTITVINYAYNADFKNITVTILVGEKEIQCYRMTGTGCDKLVVGDVITVDGAIKNYNGTVEFDKPALINVVHTHVNAEAVKENETAATCVAAGSYDLVVYCSTCGAEVSRETVTVEATGEHNYVDGVCDVCGAEEVTGPATDENLVFNGNPGLSFKDYIGMQILVSKALADGYDRVWIEAVQADPAGDVTTTLEGVVYYGVYLKFEQQVLSWSMAENITLTLWAEKDGETVKGATFSASVEDLALAKIADYAAASNTKAVAALVDMLNYGAAVQTSFDHNADMLPNTNLGSYTGTTATPEFNAENSITGTGTLSVASNSISMQAKVEIQLLIMGSISNYTVNATVGGAAAPVVVDTEKYAAYNWTLVKVAVAADKMREVYTISINDANGTPVTQVYNVSVEAYGKTQLEGAKADVVIAMMRYGDSVAAL